MALLHHLLCLQKTVTNFTPEFILVPKLPNHCSHRNSTRSVPRHTPIGTAWFGVPTGRTYCSSTRPKGATGAKRTAYPPPNTASTWQLCCSLPPIGRLSVYGRRSSAVEQLYPKVTG